MQNVYVSKRLEVDLLHKNVLFVWELKDVNLCWFLACMFTVYRINVKLIPL